MDKNLAGLERKVDEGEVRQKKALHKFGGKG